MIDIHCHLLPGIDDGATDVYAAEAMLEQAQRIGITAIVSTPHVNDASSPNYIDGFAPVFADLQLLAEKYGIKLKRAAELHHGSRTQALLDEHPELYYHRDSRTFLLEESFMQKPVNLKQRIFELLLSGYRIVMAHPERYPWLGEDRELRNYLFQAGVFMQIDAGSLNGSYSRKAYDFGWQMIKEGHCHFLASDAHNDKGRSFIELAHAYELVSEKYSPELADLLTKTNPAAIISGSTIVSPTARENPDNGFLSRFQEKLSWR
jgi:protein-tyrosine phosphatase